MTVVNSVCVNCSALGLDELAEIQLALGATRVKAEFSLEELATLVMALYDDDTYSGIKVQSRASASLWDLNVDWVIEKLREAPRHPLQPYHLPKFEEY